MSRELAPVFATSSYDVLPQPPAGWRGPTPNSVVFRLVELSRMLDEATEEAGVLGDRWVDAKGKHEVAYSRALLTSSESSADRRKADAQLQCADLRLAMDIAEQLLRACRERVNTLKEQIEIGRSLGAAARAEWSATTWTQP